ncbi:MAG: hypothetical protein DDT38_00421 [Firmicutes bacterium]|nr:hypothetical protein [candidate division NPL-UPA2 bacterium]
MFLIADTIPWFLRMRTHRFFSAALAKELEKRKKNAIKADRIMVVGASRRRTFITLSPAAMPAPKIMPPLREVGMRATRPFPRPVAPISRNRKATSSWRAIIACMRSVPMAKAPRKPIVSGKDGVIHPGTTGSPRCAGKKYINAFISANVSAISKLLTPRTSIAMATPAPRHATPKNIAAKVSVHCHS